MRTVMANLWHPLGGVSIADVSEDPLEVDLLYTEFWVQIYNLPPGFFTEAIARQFGDFIGAFVEYDVKAIMAGLRNYMRIRVKVDIRKSLKRRKKLIMAKKEFFANFKYERLSTFCFLCGKLGHSENCCPIRMVTGRKELPLEWDISLKAPSRRAATAGSIWLREPTEIWGGYQGIPKNDEGKQKKNLGELNLMRNTGANLGLNLYGKSKQIVNEELVLMEVGSIKEDRPIIGGEGKKRPRPNNIQNASTTDDMMWRNGLKEDVNQINQTAEPVGQVSRAL
ncbi:hypothetical protein Goklo_000004 [Gossypium klotzschianum]|uniref:CCHC-type domain-containing protein n=1 Tax=Gossypium klotzschianum TaxID=34286 RepID=A0A7J8WBB0_9ROSI|nr:hypothetical protein [Gossypium klotzschianum]